MMKQTTNTVISNTTSQVSDAERLLLATASYQASPVTKVKGNTGNWIILRSDENPDSGLEIYAMKNHNRNSLSILLLLILCTTVLSSCAKLPLIDSDQCRGFPFYKNFPSVNNEPLRVIYDENLPWGIGIDSIQYIIYSDDLTPPYSLLPKPERNHRLYNAFDLPHSEREKKYLKKYQQLEQAFDRKYAGWIKEKLLAPAKWRVKEGRDAEIQVMDRDEFTRKYLAKARSGKLRIKGAYWWKRTWWFIDFHYKGYLTGVELPDGLKTPSSFFSPEFLAEYPYGYNNTDPMINRHGALLYHYGMSIGAKYGGMPKFYNNFQSRLEATFAEYVLTYYYLKDYPSAAKREEVGRDMAQYYSDMAFRAAAEVTFATRRLLTASQRCGLADFMAKRIYNYILVAFTDPEQFKKIREEYEYEINRVCYDRLEFQRKEKLSRKCRKDYKCWHAWLERNKEMRWQIEWNEERCLND